MIRAVRQGASLRSAAAKFGVSVGTVFAWVERTRGQRLDRSDLTNAKPGRAWNRTSSKAEQRILVLRKQLRDTSVLGEFGPDAIRLALAKEPRDGPIPGRSTIHRVLERSGALDSVRRQRRAAPPKGWYLPQVTVGEAEIDLFDFIEDLKIEDGPLVSVLTGTSLHGALADAWIMPQASAKATLKALLQRWQAEGLPQYAQFDNDTVFQGAHQFADTVGRISRLCLALKVIPVFAPPREPGFQNAIEGFNALWQSKVWQRHHVRSVAELSRVSARYIAAYRAKTGPCRDQAPTRQPFPRRFALDLNAPLRGTIIFLRRTDDSGAVSLLGHRYAVDRHWAHRLVRCEVDFTQQRISFVALRRRAPDQQVMLKRVQYHRPHQSFKGKP